MRYISLWQPWASLLATGEKHNETRSWPTQQSGLVAIHAAARKPTGDDMDMIWSEPFVSALHRHYPPIAFGVIGLPLGAIIGVAMLCGCVRITQGV